MRAVITRVKSASVSIAGSVVGEIGHGLLILLGVGPDDTPELCEKLADKALGLRIFCDEAGKMNRSLADIGGQVLVVSQFTLYADCRKGKRPSFTGAALPELAVPLYEQFLQECRSRGFAPQHGRFGADMLVASENDGPSHHPARYGRAAPAEEGLIPENRRRHCPPMIAGSGILDAPWATLQISDRSADRTRCQI